LVGTTVDHMQQLGLGETLPATVILDVEGQVFGRILGQAKKRDIVERVEWLLGDRKKKQPTALVDHVPKRR